MRFTALSHIRFAVKLMASTSFYFSLFAFFLLSASLPANFQLNLSSRMVRVMGKGGKERLLPFNQNAAATLRAWMADRAAILAARHALYTKARELHPARWSGGTRNWSPVGAVTLNPERDSVVMATSAPSDRQRLAA